MIYGQGKLEQQGNGGIRESSKGRGRFDLLPYEAVEAWAKWTEEGAGKYGDRNWEEGLSVKDSINRMVRHAIKAANGWTDEDHLAAVMWNAACAITMMERSGKEEFRDHPWVTKGDGKRDFGNKNNEPTMDKVYQYNDISFYINDKVYVEFSDEKLTGVINNIQKNCIMISTSDDVYWVGRSDITILEKL